MSESTFSRFSAGADAAPEDFWVFAYGSLIWNPGFSYKSREPAKLAGYHRRYCIRSQIYRGTPEAPGLVLGLEKGGECEGVGYRVAGELKSATMLYLRERELITAVYDETLVSIETRDGALYEAYTYVANPAHEQYVAMTDLELAVEIIAGAAGVAGPNHEYAINTWANLSGLGIRDSLVERVADALRAREAALREA
jgi:glutathione-specific gamma-glutamylcyclotransferase